jgi:diguanylate cyclase (GGDEF)-like protein/putative nucleotidyltransferase with HDIG domain
MMIDIDHFKSINDTYGHQFGDQVLRELSDILKNNSREVDICGRYGGEEFMIVSNLQAENALKHATKIHKAVEKHTFARNDQAKHVTVSIGIAEYRGDVRHKQQLIERADTALYEAKEAGRNVIRVWKEQDVEEVSPLDRYGIRDLKKKFLGLSTQIRETYVDSTYALVKAVEAKDPHTVGHADNVAYYSVKIAEAMGMSAEDVEVIKYASLLHDVGKIGVSQDILVKKTSLTKAEYELLKRHPVIGVNILGDVGFLEKELPIILHHHERVDGSGYPHGFRGREIPVGSRILAAVDAFEAITAGRSYRGRRSEKEAIEELVQGKGTQFSPEIVDVFLEVLRKSPRREETLTFFDH